LCNAIGRFLLYALFAMLSPSFADNLPSFRLEHIYSCGDGHLWALADYGKDYGLFESSDVGATWTPKTPPLLIKQSHLAVGLDGSTYDSSVYFLNTRNGWIVTHSPGPKPVCYVCSTTDGGASWRTTHFRIPSYGGAPPTFVSFSDKKHGAILFVSDPSAGLQDKVVFTTSDGGREWTMKTNSASFPDISHLPEIGFPTGLTSSAPSIIWISELYRDDKILTPLFRSIDAGETWSNQVLGASTKVPKSYINIYSPHFFGKSGKTGIVAAQYVSDQTGVSYVQLFKTNNAGVKWHPTALLKLPAQTSSLDWCTFDQKHAWIVDADGIVYYTFNAGASWITYNPHLTFRTSSSSLELSAVSARDLVILRTGSQLIKGSPCFTSTLFTSDDHGKTWQKSLDTSQLHAPTIH